MAYAKCKITGIRKKTDELYCVINNGKKSYYLSQEVYEKYLEDKKQKEETVQYILGLLNYEYSPYLLKKLKILNENYSYEVIYKTFKQYESKIQYFLSTKLLEAKEAQKIGYIFAIAEGNINDVQKQVKYELRREKAKDNINIDLEGLNNIKHVAIKGKDISRFLE